MCLTRTDLSHPIMGAMHATVPAGLLVRCLRAGGLPFHLGWWAFTFPLGAFAVAIRTVAATCTGKIWLR